MVWIKWPIYFQQRRQSLETIQITTILEYINIFFRVKPAIVLSAIVVEMDIQQLAVAGIRDHSWNEGTLKRRPRKNMNPIRHNKFLFSPFLS